MAFTKKVHEKTPSEWKTHEVCMYNSLEIINIHEGHGQERLEPPPGRGGRGGRRVLSG
jgi:hypothetical protein